MHINLPDLLLLIVPITEWKKTLSRGSNADQVTAILDFKMAEIIWDNCEWYNWS